MNNPEWASWYGEEVEHITSFLPKGSIYQISHIGSTAIDGIRAKPIVYILLEMKPGVDIETIAQILTENGYVQMSKEKMSFNEGYTPSGFAEKVFHLHLRTAGDNNEVYFRDYLSTHPQEAKAYEVLKQSLWKNNEHDRDAYTDKKSDFVKEIVERAKRQS